MNDNDHQREDEDSIDLREIVSILLKNKLLILFCTVLFTLVGYIYLKAQNPIYETNALIQIEEPRGSGLAGLSDLGDLSSAFESDNRVATEIEIIKSRFVLGKVVEQQSLQIHAQPRKLPFAKYAPETSDLLIQDYLSEENNFFKILGIDLSPYSSRESDIIVGNIKLPEITTPIILTIKLTSPNTYDVFDDEKNLLYSNSLGSLPNTNYPIKVVIDKINAHIGAEFILSFTRKIDEISNLRSRLKISEKGKNTGILSIALESTDQTQAQNILNNIIQSYVEQNVDRLSEEADRSISFLSKQVPSVKAELEFAENAVNDYRSKSSRIDMKIETETTLKRIVAIETSLNELQLKENEISGRYKRGHPIYNTLLKQKNSLLKEKELVNQQIQKLPSKQQELLSLMRDVEVTSAVYLQLLNKMEELKVVRAGTVGNVRILDNAEVLPDPVKPKKSRIMLMVIFLGGFVGVGLAFLRTWLNSGITNPTLVQEKLNLTNYGVIPISKIQRQINKHTINTDEKPEILSLLGDSDIALEAIRSVRTSLHFATMEAINNIVMLTSPSPHAGKSFISTNLAALIAQSGKKVLLIDMDMRRGHIHKSMHLERGPGLSDYLGDEADLNDITHKEILKNLDFIATGDIPPNPSELIMSAKFTQFLETAKHNYDIVLIDTPPVLAVTDAALIGSQVGTCLLIVRHKVNHLREIQQTKKELDNLQVSLRGYIYNFAELESRGNYYRNYYSYEYSDEKRGDTQWNLAQTKLKHFIQYLKKRWPR